LINQAAEAKRLEALHSNFGKEAWVRLGFT
jgi:hypothetical protein